MEDRHLAKRHLTAAITSAESLGLDELGNDASKAPLRDPAFINLSVNVAFEMSKRLYHLVLFTSCTSWKRRKMYRLMATEHSKNGMHSSMLSSCPPADCDLMTSVFHGTPTQSRRRRSPSKRLIRKAIDRMDTCFAVSGKGLFRLYRVKYDAETTAAQIGSVYGLQVQAFIKANSAGGTSKLYGPPFLLFDQ